LRALPNKPKVFANMLYHVFIMRYTDKILRKLFKEKWVKYKQKWAYEKSSEALEEHLNSKKTISKKQRA